MNVQAYKCTGLNYTDLNIQYTRITNRHYTSIKRYYIKGIIRKNNLKGIMKCKKYYQM